MASHTCACNVDSLDSMILVQTTAATCPQGKPALHHAVSNRRVDVVELLLVLGADVHATHSFGNIHVSRLRLGVLGNIAWHCFAALQCHCAPLYL